MTLAVKLSHGAVTLGTPFTERVLSLNHSSMIKHRDVDVVLSD